MLGDADWSALYPREQYKVRTEVALHFLFALGQPLASIAAYVANLKSKNPKKLRMPDLKNHGLTPLHIAAMKANTEGAKVLLDAFETKEEKLAEIKAKDAFGWTPLHHAACTSNTLFELFVSLGGNPESKASNGLTPRELRFLAGKEVCVKSGGTLFTLIPDSQTPIPVAELDLNRRIALFGEAFIHADHNIYPQDQLKNLWQSTPEETDGPLLNLSQIYSEFEASRPSLLIRECEELIGVVPNSKELAANQDIPGLSVITEYTGLKKETVHPKRFADAFTKESIERNEYSAEGTDARFVGNEAKFSNMGFPNCCICTYTENGVERQLLLSLRPIDKGESIVWSYGAGMTSLLLGRQVLLGKAEMERFYRDHRDLIQELSACHARVQKSGGKQSVIEKEIGNVLTITSALRYPLDCPTALLYLHFKGILPFTYFADNLYTVETFVSWMQKFPYETKMLGCMIKILRKTSAMMSRHPSFDLILRQFVLGKLEKEPLINILKGLDLVVNGTQPATEDALNQRCGVVDEYLKTYNWKEDPDHPFSFERMVDVSIDYYKQLPKSIARAICLDGLQRLPSDTDTYDMIVEVMKRLSL